MCLGRASGVDCCSRFCCCIGRRVPAGGVSSPGLTGWPGRPRRQRLNSFCSLPLPLSLSATAINRSFLATGQLEVHSHSAFSILSFSILLGARLNSVHQTANTQTECGQEEEGTIKVKLLSRVDMRPNGHFLQVNFFFLLICITCPLVASFLC